jgi:hypothetical protein
MTIEAIVRQSNPPVDINDSVYIPRGMPSAGLIPFLQGAVCDPVAVSEPKGFNGPWNDRHGFYDFNPAISALLRNATLMLSDPDINLTRISQFPNDFARLQADLTKLNRTLNSTDLQEIGQSVGLPFLRGADTIQLNSAVKNVSELRDFLVHELNFSSADATSFLSSSVNVAQLWLYALRTAVQDSQCLDNFQCVTDLGGILRLTSGLNDDAPSFARRPQQLGTQVLMNTALLRQLACDQTGTFQKVFTFPKPSDSKPVQQQLCDLTPQQLRKFAEELNKDLDRAKIQQMLRPSNSTTLNQDLETVYKDFLILRKISQYLGGPIQQIISSFPPNLTLTNMTSAQQTKLFVCTLCGETGHGCDAANTKPLQKHRWSKAKNETSVAGRLLQGVQILYAPNTTIVGRVIDKANWIFNETEKLIDLINGVVKSQRALLMRFPNSAFARYAMNFTCQSLSSPALSSVTSANCSIEPLLGVMSRVSIKWKGFASEQELENYAKEQSLTGTEVWAGVVFKNMTDNEPLPKDVRYTIRMNKSLVYPPKKLKGRYWVPGPEADPTHTTYEAFGFTYIQDMVDRGIINVLTNKSVIEPGGYLQRFPYPCYIFDG